VRTINNLSLATTFNGNIYVASVFEITGSQVATHSNYHPVSVESKRLYINGHYETFLFPTKYGTETALSSQPSHTLQYKMVGV